MMGNHLAHCDRTLQLLLKTILDILLLRKGPDSLPRSWLAFYAALFASVLLSMVATVIVFPDVVPMHDITLLLAILNVAFYFLVLYIAGYPARILQSLTAVLCVDAMLTVFYLGGFLAVNVLADRSMAMSLAVLISFWSVPVEGHIIARALGRIWVVGIVIAIAAYILLMLTYWQLVGRP